MNLRHAAEGVGVLHPAEAVLLYNFAPLDQSADILGDSPLPSVGAERVRPRVEGVGDAVKRFNGERRRDVRGLGKVLGGHQRHYAHGAH